MSSLTNFGEYISLLYAVGPPTDTDTPAAAAGNKQPQTPVIHLGTFSSDASAEHGTPFTAIRTVGNADGYLAQTATFSSSSVSGSGGNFVSTNTNNIVFGPNLGTTNWVFDYIVISVMGGVTNFPLFRFKLPTTVTVAPMQSFTIPTGTLTCRFIRPTDRTSFNFYIRNAILNNLLNTTSASTSFAGIGLSAGAFAGGASLVAFLTDTPRSDDETIASSNQPTQVQAISIQPITFEFNAVDVSAERETYTGETRVSNSAAVNFVWPPDQAGLTGFTATHLVLGYLSNENDAVPTGSSIIPIATVALPSPVQYGPTSNVTFPIGSISVGFE